MKKKSPSLLIPVVLCGGTGSRLWPISRESQPKPFIKLPDDETLLEKTYQRVSCLLNIPKINGKQIVLTVTNRDYYFLSKDEIEKTNLYGIFLLEPEGRNTAPAISIAACWIKKHYGQKASMLVMPADHVISDLNEFKLKVNQALELLDHKPLYLVTFGIRPKSADTGFGYIETGKALEKGFKVTRFYEKPNLKKAESFLKSKNFLWNSGIFCLNVGLFLDEMKVHSPQVFKHAENSWNIYRQTESKDHTKIEIPSVAFKKCPNISIDCALMEKSKKVAVIPADFQWSDVGSWLSFSSLIPRDQNGNSSIGNNMIFNSKDNFIQGNNRFIAAVGVNNLIIIDTPDALLVIDKSHTQDIKVITSKLKQNRQEILYSHQTIKRPWGSFTTLQTGPSFKIKYIEVNPLKSLSLQSHKHRSEHWVVIEGEAEVINQEKVYRVKTNESTFILEGTKHRLINPLPNTALKIIEVQSGSYLGEDDIERFEDQFGRT